MKSPAIALIALLLLTSICSASEINVTVKGDFDREIVTILDAEGGPVMYMKSFDIPTLTKYADTCALCYDPDTLSTITITVNDVTFYDNDSISPLTQEVAYVDFKANFPDDYSHSVFVTLSEGSGTLKIVCKGNDVNLTRMDAKVYERKLSTPKIKLKPDELDTFSVEDEISVKNPSGLAVSDVVAELEYPYSANNAPVDNVRLGSIPSGGKNDTVVKYQKKNPYVVKKSETMINNTTRKIELEVYSYEDLKAILDYPITNATNITLKVNGKDVDFRVDGGKIESYVPLVKGKNKIEIVHTLPTVSVAAPVKVVEAEKKSIIEQIVDFFVNLFRYLFGGGGG